jgi:hypothetical protein
VIAHQQQELYALCQRLATLEAADTAAHTARAAVQQTVETFSLLIVAREQPYFAGKTPFARLRPNRLQPI